MRHRSATLLVSVGLVLGLLAGNAFADASPNPTLTPGAADPAVTQANVADTICASGYSHTVRNVSTATKHKIYASYHISKAQQRKYVIDHLIPLEVGGSNAVANLWPEPRTEAKAKDRLENALRTDVCTGALPLADAQHLATGPVPAGLAQALSAADSKKAADASAAAAAQQAEQQRQQQIAAYVAAQNNAKLAAYLQALAAQKAEQQRRQQQSSGGGGAGGGSAPPSGGGSGPVVHPGAFCAPAGAHGVTSAGTPMVCGPASDGRNRWHSS